MIISNVLFYATLVLNFAGLIFAGVFLWINLSGGFSELSDRNASALKIAKISMIISIVFGLFTCLLSDTASVYEAIERSALLFSIIAITWLAVILACGIAMLVMVISKAHYRSSVSNSIKKLFTIALPGAAICLVLTWLFS